MNLENYFNQLKAFIFGTMIYLNIDKEIAMILIVLIFSDMAVGGLKAIFVNELSFSFKASYAGFIRKILLLCIVMVLALLARGLGFEDFKAMVIMVMKAMILSEGVSIINNIRSIYDKKEHKSNDFISIIIEKISKYLDTYMNKIMRIFEEDKNEIK